MTLCNICGRPGCRCGEVHTERVCPTHRCATVVEAIPSYTTLSDGFTSLLWYYVLRCPFPKCDYVRSLKRQDGPRSNNRKTTRKNK